MFTRPMTHVEHAIKYFYDNPTFTAVAVGLPLISYEIYWGIKNIGEGMKNKNVLKLY